MSITRPRKQKVHILRNETAKQNIALIVASCPTWKQTKKEMKKQRANYKTKINYAPTQLNVMTTI